MAVRGRQFDPGANEVAGQLPMFMTPREILRNTHPNDVNPYAYTRGDVWKDALRQSQDVGGGSLSGDPKVSLADSIKTHGVQNAVAIQPDKVSNQWGTRSGEPAVKSDALLNGHHRTIAAAVFKPKALIPVKWTDQMVEGE